MCRPWLAGIIVILTLARQGNRSRAARFSVPALTRHTPPGTLVKMRKNMHEEHTRLAYCVWCRAEHIPRPRPRNKSPFPSFCLKDLCVLCG